VLCTEYDVGVGMDGIAEAALRQGAALSLGAVRKFRLRRRIGEKWERHTLQAEPRSLHLMDGGPRQIWEHSIPLVEQRRYSITLRTMKGDIIGR
jgi:alkylated DNA repair dioxygenase AlkB